MREVGNGFVRLVDSLGNDMSVVKAARVSYGNESKGLEADTKLINYMMKHKHGTPFEHINFTFHIKCPIFIARQWFRHRIGSFNEISGRYVKLDTLCWTPTNWRKNLNLRNKQDSVIGEWDENELEDIESSFQNALNVVLTTYEHLLEKGVAREQARAILPVGTYTEFYWTVNARSLFNFLELRTHHTAQKEMQEYAEAIHSLSQPIAPISFSAWEKNR
tara:strand:+ start:1473 stop:2129 length:657 start_codon:yes stop_codon:yes gene_type:complete